MTRTHRLKVLETSDPAFAEVAEMVNPPELVGDKTIFTPAYAGFDIASGPRVDISYYYDPPKAEPWLSERSRFDRHLRTDELWVVTKGEILVPMMKCARPDDPEDLPTPEAMACFRIKEGDLFVLKPNVWHSGPWATRPNTAVAFYMLLSGHRSDASGATVDHIVKAFEEGVSVLPDVDQSGATR